MGLNKIKRIIGTPIRVRPIVDIQQYIGNEKSYSGGSLYDKNLIILSDFPGLYSIVEKLDIQEGVVPELFYTREEIVDKSIFVLTGEKKVGPYTNIINIFKITSCNENSIYRIYNSIQNEVSYLLEKEIHGSISTAIIYDSKLSIADKSSVFGLKGLIDGLGITLPNHRIISNGIIADENIPMSAVINSMVFLNGKYGCVLNGEVLELKE